jgi:predicted deacylase
MNNKRGEVMRDRLGTCQIKKGELNYGILPVDEKNEIPVAVAKGRLEGKFCLITGGMHGDEINGPWLVHRVMHTIDPKKLSGTIVYFPLLNVSGFHHKQRHVFEDDTNLNRCFKFNGNSLGYKIARTVNTVIEECDFGIDCHDSGYDNVLLPQPRVHVDEAGKCIDGCTHELGRLLGTKIILERKGEEGMLAVETYKRLNKAILTVEIGGGMVLWEDMLTEGVEGIKNILVHHGLLQGEIKLPEEQFVILDINRFNYPAGKEGLISKKVALGKDVHTGDLIAEIYNPLNEQTERVISRHCGFVFSIKHQDKIDKEEPVVSILQHNTCPIHKTKPQEGFLTFNLQPNV